MQILTRKADKKIDSKNVSFKVRLDSKSKKLIMTLRSKIKRLIIRNLSALTEVSNIAIIFRFLT